MRRINNPRPQPGTWLFIAGFSLAAWLGEPGPRSWWWLIVPVLCVAMSTGEDWLNRATQLVITLDQQSLASDPGPL